MFFEITLKVALQTKKINIEKNKKYRKNENWIPFSDALFCGQGIDPCEMFWTLV